ncbi:MAG: MFS transporter [endosymbiont of Galathealinum brachiosum]|uniref:MFS transporter n=1 Tax=endosymbiont of Galathealinum brachiosum TaxID=2200906 RepID=A0A370DD39_9GAMM|nr:MAG: MFS transporter [endosymbiont of Galathealinum brachiosum]
MSSFSHNVPVLAFCQAMSMSGASLMVASAALVGLELAEDKSLSTLPLAAMFISIMLTSIPAAMLMNKIGRKASFLFASLFALSGAVLSSWSILQHEFWGFVAGVSLIGVFNSFANYYRFTAADAVDFDHKSRAISYVLAGGVLAAVIGPNLASYTHDSFNGVAFAGSYASLVILYLMSVMALSFLKLPEAEHKDEKLQVQRSLIEIVTQPACIVAIICGMLGYGVMSFVMTATPLAMNHHSHDFSDTSFVIQWHVLAMFAPSFFTGSIIRKVGELKVMFSGVLLGFTCVFVNLTGSTITHFWLALVLLGLSWNFIFVGATSLLTQTYHRAERFKVQALNDFIVFSVVAFASLSAGYLQFHYGWKSVNLGVLPLLMIALSSIVYLMIYTKKNQFAR